MTDVAIVGGGIVGCACAYELVKAGASVTLIEYGKAGMQATNAAAGMLAPYSESHAPDAMLHLGMRAMADYPGDIAALEAECGFSIELQQYGILRVAVDDDGASTLRRRHEWQRDRGITIEWLDGDACREVEPRLSMRVLAGLYSPAEASVNNQMLALALLRAAESRGARIRERTPVRRLRSRSGRIAIDTGAERIDADVVVLAAGARSGQLAASAGIDLRVHPIRGQMIALGGMRPPISRIVWGARGYLVPRANGLVFAGATVEDVGFRRRTTIAGMRRLRAAARELVPQLGAAQVQFDWAGLRPGTADGLPIIGPVDGTNLVAATGHYRNGILLGPVTGKVVARGIMSNDWSDAPPEFSPARFDAARSVK